MTLSIRLLLLMRDGLVIGSGNIGRSKEEDDVGKVGRLKRVRMICFLRTKRVEKNVLWVFTKTNSLFAQTREVVIIN